MIAVNYIEFNSEYQHIIEIYDIIYMFINIYILKLFMDSVAYV